MPVVGVICGYDGKYESFKTCIDHHEARGTLGKNCHCPVFPLKDARDNAFKRRGAGISASTIIGCPRSWAIEQYFDLYEAPISMYNKSRGTFLHAQAEADSDPPEWVIRERRLYFQIDDEFRITGQPDEADAKYKVLIDYKSKDNLPKNPDVGHELQFNIYAFLLGKGRWADGEDKDELAGVEITRIAAHYVTWKTKADKAWLKMEYPVWDYDDTERIIRTRIQPLIDFKKYGIIPACDPYVEAKYWKCQCEKWTDQLIERGIVTDVEDLEKDLKRRWEEDNGK